MIWGWALARITLPVTGGSDTFESKNYQAHLRMCGLCGRVPEEGASLSSQGWATARKRNGALAAIYCPEHGRDAAKHQARLDASPILRW